MRTLRVGIASYEQMKARTLAIARGKYKPAAGEPKVWFTSAESFARVLSDRNRALLGIIAESGPESLAHLAELTGRKKSNLSRTLKTQPRSTGLGHPESSVSEDLVDAAVIKTGTARDRSRVTG